MRNRKSSDELRQAPLYRRVAEQIGVAIAEGRYRDLLPPQEELCKAYGVGRSTIREALRVLDEQGMIRVRQGSATRILGPRQNFSVKPGLESFVGVTRLIEREGLNPGTAFVQVRRAVSSTHFFPAFGGRPVILLERVRTADGTPVLFSVDVFEDRGWSLEELTDHFRQSGLLEWLARHGLRVSVAEASIRAVEADPVVRERLDIPSHQPVLFIEEISYDHVGKVIICSQDYYDPRHVSFRVLRRAEGEDGL